MTCLSWLFGLSIGVNIISQNSEQTILIVAFVVSFLLVIVYPILWLRKLNYEQELKDSQKAAYVRKRVTELKEKYAARIRELSEKMDRMVQESLELQQELMREVRERQQLQVHSQMRTNELEGKLATETKRLYQLQSEFQQRIQELESERQFSVLAELRSLEPTEFERFVMRLFQQLGYDTELTGKSGDEGVDVIAVKGETRVIVQCKRYRKNVSPSAARDLYGAMHHYQATEAHLITTGTISQKTKEWCISKPIHLIDGEALVQLVEINQLASEIGRLRLSSSVKTMFDG
jgi:restriction endonuclease Mrr